MPRRRSYRWSAGNDFGTATLDASYEPFRKRADEVMRTAGYKEGENWVTKKFPGAEHSERSWRERAGGMTGDGLVHWAFFASNWHHMILIFDLNNIWK
jgi:hypothetical protein